jgi:preprotein translocase subunit YajC
MSPVETVIFIAVVVMVAVSLVLLWRVDRERRKLRRKLR